MEITPYIQILYKEKVPDYKKKLVDYTNIKIRMYKQEKVQRYVSQSQHSKDNKRLKDERIC